MVLGQAGEFQKVRMDDWDRSKAGTGRITDNLAKIGLKLACAHFQHDFPNRHDADDDRVGWIDNQRAGVHAKRRIIGQAP